VDEPPDGPDNVEKQKEDKSFFIEAGSGVFIVEERAIERSPE
jgi:hypothetical protein